jgi:CRP/FNR family transcriptional regulator
LYELKKLLTRKHVRRGKTVYLSGDQVNELYFVESGKIEISKTDEQGRRLTLWHINPSEVFCVSSVITGQAIADADAAEDTTLFCLTKTHFDDLLQRFPVLAVGLLKCLSGRVRSYSQSVDSVEFNPATTRIAGILLANQTNGAKGERMCSLSMTSCFQ